MQLLARTTERLRPAFRSTRREGKMANVYVEARPKVRPEESGIDDYVVEDRVDHVLGTFKTQETQLIGLKMRDIPL